MNNNPYGELVRQLRSEKNLTLVGVAKAAGIRKGYLSGIEHGKVNPPSAPVVRALAQVLGAGGAASRDLKVRMLALAWAQKAPCEIQMDMIALVTQWNNP